LVAFITVGLSYSHEGIYENVYHNHSRNNHPAFEVKSIWLLVFLPYFQTKIWSKIDKTDAEIYFDKIKKIFETLSTRKEIEYDEDPEHFA
jgi:hypothetical protein